MTAEGQTAGRGVGVAENLSRPSLAEIRAVYRSRNRAHRDQPFIGVDGEGGGTDRHGRQNYLLMHAAGDTYEAELFDNNRRLSTEDCLDFILALPKNAIAVGYFFTYDATQILRDLPRDRLCRVFCTKDPTQKCTHNDRAACPSRGHGPGQSPYLYWGEYAIDFRPRQYLRVARCEAVPEKGRMDGRLWGYRAVPGTARTVNEVGGFFQGPFVAQLRSWEIGDPKTVAMIAANKDKRAEFNKVGKRIRAYCAAECHLLSQLMTRFRDTCRETDTMPVNWRGAGAISSALHKRHGTPKRGSLIRPVAFEAAVMRAYYGGRFEIVRVGHIQGPIWEHDINSAYPAAMRQLYCPVHARYKRIPAGADLPTTKHYLADITYDHPDGTILCGFPHREKGRLFWPQRGRGTYWAPEIREAMAHGAILTQLHGGVEIHTDCDCRPYDWIADLYQRRKDLGKSTRGYPLKLGLNGAYGKLAQRIGAAPYRDYAAAGLITSYTRAWLMQAARAAPQSVLMLATDGIFATEPLTTIETGGELGQWEVKQRDDLFIVQPGIYWSSGSADLPKTRGIPRSQIIDRRVDFELEWQRFYQSQTQHGELSGAGKPAVSVPVHSFIGHRLALARGKPLLAGSWRDDPKSISFDWKAKRQSTACYRDGYAATLPHRGAYDKRSEPFDRQALVDLDEQLMLDEAAPDYQPWGNSGE